MNKFASGEYVQHVKSGGLYVIEDIPPTNRLESTGEPAYGYREIASPQRPLNLCCKWQREQKQMEDGRFVAWCHLENKPASESQQARNLEAWWEMLPELLKYQDEGQRALISDGKLHSIHPNFQEAVARGYEAFGLGKFLCMEISKEQYKLYLESRAAQFD